LRIRKDWLELDPWQNSIRTAPYSKQNAQTQAATALQGPVAERRLHTDGFRDRRSAKFFSMDREQATRIMLKVHMEGRGVCGVYPRDIAATKVEQVTTFAREQPASPGVRNGGKLNDCAGT
jgi:hypothetical protein